MSAASSRSNPLKLNPLQLKTLTLLQELARLDGHSQPGEEPGSRIVFNLPHPHGNHFHLCDAVVVSRDATGLFNEAPWVVLERKGLIRSHYPVGAEVTAAGMGYDTGLRDSILHRADH